MRMGRSAGEAEVGLASTSPAVCALLPRNLDVMKFRGRSYNTGIEAFKSHVRASPVPWREIERSLWVCRQFMTAGPEGVPTPRGPIKTLSSLPRQPRVSPQKPARPGSISAGIAFPVQARKTKRGLGCPSAGPPGYSRKPVCPGCGWQFGSMVDRQGSGTSFRPGSSDLTIWAALISKIPISRISILR
jgi:hypothetical protein